MTSSDYVTVAIGAYEFDPLEADNSRRDRAPAGPEPDAWIVQFSRPLHADDIARLRREYALDLREYVPHSAYVERLTAASAEQVRRDPLVRACAPYEAEYKLSPMIGRIPTAASGKVGAEQPVRVDIVLFDDADPRAAATALAAASFTDTTLLDDRPIDGSARLRCTAPDAASLEHAARLTGVRWIEPVARMTDDNSYAAATIQSGDPATPAVWNHGLHGENQVIGLIDSGPPDIGHCFLIDTTDNTPRPAHRKMREIRNASGSPPGDHATFVAGCAAGDDVHRPGQHARRGGAWAAQLVSGNNRDLTATTLLAELTAAAAAGAFIHSNSWHDDTAGAGNPAIYTRNAADVDTFTWHNEDHLVLGSSGNIGEQQGPPGTAKNAICVSAAHAHPTESTLGDGNPGPTADGRRKPDLVAVGCGIRSAAAGTTCGIESRDCATSWATPHTAAAAALVRQYFTEGRYPTGGPVATDAFTPTGALIKATLLNSARRMTTAAYPDNACGWGLIHLDRVLSPSTGRLYVRDIRHAAGLTTGDTHTEHLAVTDPGEPLKVTLTWSDPPGTAGATDPVVNNLDLRVTDPTGTSTFLGNRFSGGRSIAGGLADPVNNVEMVLVNNPEVGMWTIEVTATRVNVGNPGQGFALCATGVFAPLPVPARNTTADIVTEAIRVVATRATG